MNSAEQFPEDSDVDNDKMPQESDEDSVNIIPGTEDEDDMDGVKPVSDDETEEEDD